MEDGPVVGRECHLFGMTLSECRYAAFSHPLAQGGEAYLVFKSVGINHSFCKISKNLQNEALFAFFRESYYM